MRVLIAWCDVVNNCFILSCLLSGDMTPDPRLSTYKDVMLNQKLNQEQRVLRAEISAKAKSGELKVAEPVAPPPPVKRRRWDQPSSDANGKDISAAATPIQPSATLSSAKTPGRRQWEETPGRPLGDGVSGAATPGSRQWAETPAYVPTAATPGRDALAVSFSLYPLLSFLESFFA